MRRKLTIDDALRDRNLLGVGLGDVRLWSTWRAVLKGAFGLSLKADERALFGVLAGGREPPPARVQELWAIVGRRGGKSGLPRRLVAILRACHRARD